MSRDSVCGIVTVFNARSRLALASILSVPEVKPPERVADSLSSFSAEVNEVT